jgi:alpha-2-macroglobulin
MKRFHELVISVLNSIFGKLSWQAPPWAISIYQYRKNNVRSFYGIVALILCLAVIGTGGYLYIKYRPLPNLILLNASLYEIKSPSEEKMPPEPLFISFIGNQPEGGNPGVSAARLDLAGKKLTTGITITPAIEGIWEWDGGVRLKFTPSQNWPASTDYTVVISKEILQKGLKLKTNKVEFSTSPFSASFESGPTLYTDPRDRSIHQITATGLFTHIIDEKTIRDGISMVSYSNDGDNRLNFSASIDKTGRRIHIISDPVKIEEYEKFVQIQFKKGIQTIQGKARLSNECSAKVTIPTISTFFRVTGVDSLIIRNQKEEPEQTIMVDFSDTVTPKNLEGAVTAWLLPEKNTENGQEHYTSASEITQDILSKSPMISLRQADIPGESSDKFGFIYDATENRDLFVSINAGIRSESKFTLTKNYVALLKTPAYPKEIKILGNGGFLSSSGNKSISIQTRGLYAIKVKIRRLLPDQVQHLVSQTGGDITNPYFYYSYYFDETNISEPFVKTLTLASDDPKKPLYTHIDFSEFLDPSMKKPGIFFVEAVGLDPNTKKEIHIQDDSYSHDTEQANKRTIIISDLAILMKSTIENGWDIFVESVAAGSPADNAEVMIVARNGEILQSEKTGADGHAAFSPLGEAQDKGREPSFCMVKKGADMTFLPLNKNQRQMNLSRFDIGGLNTRYINKDKLNAFLFSDRGIYRPGETAQLGMIIRSKGFTIPTGIPIELHITDPTGSLLIKKELTVPDDGFPDYSFPTTTASATGQYQAELYLISEDNNSDRMIGGVSFKVEDFEPDKMRITNTLSDKAKGWKLPENLTVSVTLKNLFGAPAQNRKVTGKIILRPMGFYFNTYPGFIFTDPTLNNDNPLKEVTQEIEPLKTDVDGNSTIDLNLMKFEKGTYQMSLYIEGFDEGGQKSVKTSNTALVSPMQYIVGYKADGDMSFIRENTKRNLKFISIDRELSMKTIEGLSIRKIKILTISALVKNENGTYGYQSARKEERIWEKPFIIPEAGEEIAIETDMAGDFALEIRDSSGTLLCRAPYSVAGESNITAEIEKAVELSIKLGSESVKQGGELNFQLTTPYNGAGLITIETDRVHAYKWFRTEGLTSIQTINIPETLEGNAYVCVALVRSMSDPEIFTSPLSYTVASFSIDREKRALVPEIKVPEKVLPGSVMNISYKTARKSRIVVFAVDEGILQYAAYKTPVPLDHFLQKLALEVSSYQTADLILPEYDLLIQRMGIGGDTDAAALRARHLNPFARKNNKPAVFWSGILDSGPEEQSVSWETPDTFNGEVRVMAVAADSSGMGSIEKSVIVRGPFVINPVLPLAVTPGDIFTMTVGVANVSENSGKAFPVTLIVDTGKGFSVDGDKTKKLFIDENGESSAVFNVKTTRGPGEESLRFRAESGEIKARTSASVSIRPPVPMMTTLTSGVIDSGNMNLPIKRKILPEYSMQKISLSSSPLVLAAGLDSWLNEFPHGCTEQLLSRAFPALAYSVFPGESYTKEKAEAKVRTAVAMLRERQTEEGGFAMWPGGFTNDFASLYSLHFLTDASQAGFYVPKDMLSRGISYLRIKAGQTATGESVRLRAYSIYLLTRNEIVTSNFLIDIERDLELRTDWKKDITSSFIAASYQLLKQEKQAKSLFGRFKPSETEGDIFSLGSGAAEGINLYLTARHFPEELSGIGEDDINRIIKPILNGDFNTFDAAWTILALSAWPAGDGLESVSVIERTEKDEAKTLGLTNDPFPSAIFDTNAASIDIKANRRLFYVVSQRGFDRDLPAMEIRDGLEIIREFRPSPSKINLPIASGDDIKVILKIRATNRSEVRNAAVTDMFAGCFSPDTKSIRENENRVDYIDVREDRAVFYGSFTDDITELSYTVRVTAPGVFIAPPAFAESLYDSRIRARSLPETIKVEK